MALFSKSISAVLILPAKLLLPLSSHVPCMSREILVCELSKISFVFDALNNFFLISKIRSVFIFLF